MKQAAKKPGYASARILSWITASIPATVMAMKYNQLKINGMGFTFA